MLGERIKKLRKQFGYSQQQLALKMHITQGAISQWENGLTDPAADQLVTLASIFGTTTDKLLGRELPDQPPAASSDILPLSNTERRLVSGFRCLNADGQQYILQTLDTAIASNIYKQGDLSLENEA